MADIFIAYAREDQGVAEKLNLLLSQQWSTWWDDKIVGSYVNAIEAEIPKASCIVAVFSQSSRGKTPFRDELRISTEHSRVILPVQVDDSPPPYGYGDLSRIQLLGWNGETDHPGFLQLQRKLATIVVPKEKPRRLNSIADGRVPLPSLFLSVSSHETQISPADAVQALRIFRAPTILVSAYDMVTRRKPQAMIDGLKDYQKNGGFVLVDSGNYEAYRLGIRRWKVDDLKEALAQTPHDWAFCFDVMNPKHDPDRAVGEIVEAVERDREFTAAPILPIVHVPRHRNGGYKLEHIPQIVREVAARLEPPLIAIPERELGAGLIARAKTVRAIREELSKLPYYQPLHLLGTGNPWSIAILAAAGADTFDGLEWCRFAVDQDKDRLHHFQHFDFFTEQTSRSTFMQTVLEDPNIEFAGKVAFHNLDYFIGFAKIMREAVADGGIEAFVVGLVGKREVSLLKDKIAGIFK